MEFPGGWELVAILVVVFLVFGYKKLPDATRSLGRSMRIFKAEVKGMKDDDGPATPTTTTTTTTAEVAPVLPAAQPVQQHVQPVVQPVAEATPPPAAVPAPQATGPSRQP